MVYKSTIVAFCVALSGCITSADDVSLVDRYATVLSCIRGHVDSQLTTKKENPEQIRSFVYAGIRNCETQVSFYVDGIVDQILFDLRWVYVSDEGRSNVRTNVLVSTSLLLQKQYNKQEAGS